MFVYMYLHVCVHSPTLLIDIMLLPIITIRFAAEIDKRGGFMWYFSEQFKGQQRFILFLCVLY